MALDYRKCAEEISKNIGGGSNVISAAHCATRLRLVIADNSKVNKSALEEVDGVKKWAKSKNGTPYVIIVRKIPFVVFMGIGLFLFITTGVLYIYDCL